MVKNLIFVKGMIFACLLQSNLTYAITNTTTNIKSSKSTSKPIILNKFLQFILPAASGSIGKDTLSGFSRMQLVDVDTQVTYFTNHPRRITGSMATGFFLKRWIKPPPRDFTANPPNAMVTYIDDSKQLQQFFIVQLIAPLYQESTRTLSFTIKQLPGSPLYRLKSSSLQLLCPKLLFAEFWEHGATYLVKNKTMLNVILMSICREEL
ncbi:hypothetical protein B6N58_08715 [Legionella micdadei]|uniref:hypothetical protein n=1 Tax=Legionella micdadei TaxID=451 RepID=UPI0009EF7D7D|nr:hypothetical protein [Legionella micdadei]ARG97737.1 hypothetical protein B6N58_08715 [Legionella micdadei]